MYQALYRKWRPKTFSQVVGQDHITGTLQRQVAEGRTAHAYLFTGTRGTGKTTCARILAKAVNCLHPEDGAPCNQCEACRGIDSGSLLDVTELDAASNSRVDDIRELLSESVYTPTVLKKRVYIIDEVHMLSTQAFNALLKTIEEPPEHLMFILATTELHKVPATILSRCQRFTFKRILPRDMEKHLLGIAQAEQIDLTPDGAEILARMANGALRDALSLLDQCRVAQGQLDSRAVLDILGLAGSVQTVELMDCILRRDAARGSDPAGRAVPGRQGRGRHAGGVGGPGPGHDHSQGRPRRGRRPADGHIRYQDPEVPFRQPAHAAVSVSDGDAAVLLRRAGGQLPAPDGCGAVSAAAV